jgi:hypothetical protein
MNSESRPALKAYDSARIRIKVVPGKMCDGFMDVAKIPHAVVNVKLSALAQIN